MFGSSNLNQRQNQQIIHAALGSSIQQSNVSLFTLKTVPVNLAAKPAIGSQHLPDAKFLQSVGIPQVQRANSSYHQMSMPNFGMKVSDSSKMQRSYIPLMNQPRIGQSARSYKPAVQMSMTQMPPNQFMRKNLPASLGHSLQNPKPRSKVIKMMQAVAPAQALQKKAPKSKPISETVPHVAAKGLIITPQKVSRSSNLTMQMASYRDEMFGTRGMYYDSGYDNGYIDSDRRYPYRGNSRYTDSYYGNYGPSNYVMRNNNSYGYGNRRGYDSYYPNYDRYNNYNGYGNGSSYYDNRRQYGMSGYRGGDYSYGRRMGGYDRQYMNGGYNDYDNMYPSRSGYNNDNYYGGSYLQRGVRSSYGRGYDDYDRSYYNY